MLLTPENVSSVIETLRMMYGRPDLIIHTLVQQVRREQPPRMERLETIINFALAVQNLCAIIKVTRLDSHMNNPSLMQEIMEKLPSTLKLEWSRLKRSLPNATMEDLGKWLYEIAQAASDVVTPASVYNDKENKSQENPKKNEAKQKPDPFMMQLIRVQQQVHRKILFHRNARFAPESVARCKTVQNFKNYLWMNVGMPSKIANCAQHV